MEMSGEMRHLLDLISTLTETVERHEAILRGRNGDTPGIIEQVRDLRAEQGTYNAQFRDVHQALYGDPKDPRSHGLVAEVEEIRKEREKRDGRNEKLYWLLVSTVVVGVLNFLIQALPALAQALQP